MNIAYDIRTALKKLPSTYLVGTKYRRWQQSRHIEREQLYYERRADDLGISKDFSVKYISKQLKERLSKRNIYPKQKSKQDLHIVYASNPAPWDRQNIVPALEGFGRVTTYFYSQFGFIYRDINWLRDRQLMNAHFLDFVSDLHKKKPIDLVLTYLSGREIDVHTVNNLNDMGIVTSTVHYDDRLSFKGRLEGGRWTGPVDVSKSYDINLTQAPESLIKYRAEGSIVMLWPLAANQDLFCPKDVPFKYDVSFLGSAHGNRKPLINYLRREGVNVETFGSGWSNGFVPDEKVPEIFSSSRINLNFGDIAYTGYQCGKGRDVEIPMSGGLMLTTHNPHLADYFELDREIFTFRNRSECLRQIRRLMAAPSLCETARQLARQRALAEHKWKDRIRALLEVVGFREGNELI